MNLLKIAMVLALTVSAALAQINPPAGRLTLVSNTPVMTSDVTGASTIYYTPYIGNTIPQPDGSGGITNQTFAQVSLTLSSSFTAGNIYDIFYTLTGYICVGPAWASSSSRGTGSGSTQLTQFKGIWTNANSISNCWTNSSVSSSFVAEAATYLGSVYMTANGETSMQLKPSAASGGTNNVLGLYNAYNRVRLTAYSRDSTSGWVYSTASWRAADNSTSNKISFIDGLQQSHVTGNYSVLATATSNSIGALIGLNEDSSTSTPNISSIMSPSGNETSDNQYSVTETFYPLLGLHYVQAVEYATGNEANWYGVLASQQLMALSVTMDM